MKIKNEKISEKDAVEENSLLEQTQRPTTSTPNLLGPFESFPGDNNCGIQFTLYKRRWFMLGIFVLYATTAAIHWNQYNVIANIIRRYYGVSHLWVEWTAISYSAFYIILIFPASWLLEQRGLRCTVICGAVAIAIGSWIKVFSAQPQLFYLGFIGQCFIALSGVFVLSLPSPLAAAWFGPEEVATACSIGVFGTQLGLGLGFVLPPIMVHNHEDLNLVGADLKFMYIILATFATILLLIIVFFFRKVPETPPSAAQLTSITVRSEESLSFRMVLKLLLTNKNFVMLLISFGLKVGIFYALSTLLNPLILKYFPGHETDVGLIGLCFIVAGMIGSICSGIVLDKTHRFKQIIIFIYTSTMLSMWVFTFTLASGHILVVYVTTSVLGFFMAAYLPVGFEFGSELTFPQPEGTVCGLMNWGTEVSGLVFTTVYSKLFYTYGDIAANVTMAAILLVGSAITTRIYPDLRRRAAKMEAT